MVIIPQLLLAMLVRMMTTFWVGTLMRRPSASRPDLMAMASSRALMLLFLITTWSQDSGSRPSLLPLPELVADTPSNITYFDSTGWNCQKLAPLRVMPWM